MYSFLHPSKLSVIDGLEAREVVFAKDQEEYNALKVLRSTTPEVAVLSRWALTPEQRVAIAEGADIYLESWTFGKPLQPVRLAIGSEVSPEYISEVMGF